MKHFDSWRGRRPASLGLAAVFLAPGLVGAEWSWNVQDSKVAVPLNSVAFGVDRWVAVGSVGAVTVSQDASNWLRVETEESRTLSAVAYGGGQFVAVGYDGVVMTSDDGLSWVSQASTTATNFWGVTFAANSYVAVGDAGVVAVSPQGTQWTTGTAGVDTLEAVAYGDSRVVAVGYRGSIVTSTNGGASWASAGSGTTAWLKGVAYGGGRFVAVGLGGAVLVSTNGMDWEGQTLDADLAFEGVSYGEAGFVAVGADLLTGNTGIIAGSADGRQWEVESSGVPRLLYAASSGLGEWVVVGDAGMVLTTTAPGGQVGPFTLEGIRVLPDGSVAFEVVGLEVGQTARLDTRAGLESGVPWEFWRTVTGTGAAVPVMDSTVNGSEPRFYRLRYP